MKFTKMEAEEFKEMIEDYKKKKTPRQIEKEGKVPILLSEEEFKDRLEFIKKSAMDLEIKTGELEINSKNLRRLLNQLYAVWSIGAIGAVFGLGLARYGFSKWHSIQIQQDKILKRQVDSLTETNMAAKALGSLPPL